MTTQIRHMVPTRKDDTMLRWVENSSMRRSTQSRITIRMRAMDTMPTLLVNLSMISRLTMPPVLAKSASDKTVMMTPMVMAVCFRGKFSLSRTADTTTSNRENNEVKPAMVSEPKNSTPKMAPPGISLMMVGKAINARPMPLEAASFTVVPLWAAMNPSAENTPMPANTSNEELANAVTMPVPVRLVRGLR